MDNQETIESESTDIKEEYEIKIDDNKLRIEINNDEIIFILMIGIPEYKYIKKYKYNEIVKELELYGYNDIKEVYNYLINNKYKIIKEDKKIILNNKEIILYEKQLTNEELLKVLVEEVREIKDDNKNINENREVNKKENDNEIKKLENIYNELKDLAYEVDDNIKSQNKN